VVFGTDGNDTITAGAGDSTITGGQGDDILDGAGGGNTYLYSLGDGSDRLLEDDNRSGSGAPGTDVLVFMDLNADEVEWSRNGRELYADILGTEDRITVAYQYFSDTAPYGIDEFRFADGVVWSRADVNENAIVRGTDGDDTLVGDSIADSTVIGGLGDDILDGGGGSNTYIYARGDGSDTIKEDDNRWGSGAPGLDRLILEDLLAIDVTLERDGRALTISVDGTDEISISYQFFNESLPYGIDEIELADGTIWDRGMIYDLIA